MMDTSSTKPAVQKPAARKVRGPHSLKGGTREANRLAIGILEVLAGGCTPAEAAGRLGVSLVRYYQLETRALEGLVTACEPKPLGKQPALETRIAALERQLQQAQRECARQQALVRATQRSAGLLPPAKSDKPAAAQNRSRRRRRRPTVRALKAAARLRKQVAHDEASAIQQESPTTGAEPQVRQSPGSSNAARSV